MRDLKGNVPEMLVICPWDKSIALPTEHASLSVQSQALKGALLEACVSSTVFGKGFSKYPLNEFSPHLQALGAMEEYLSKARYSLQTLHHHKDKPTV